MTTDRPPTLAGGFPIAAGAMAGAVLGFVAGEPTIGFFAGLATGIAIAMLLWWRSR